MAHDCIVRNNHHSDVSGAHIGRPGPLAAIFNLTKQLDELIVKVIHDYDSTIKILHSKLIELEVLYESDIINIMGLDTVNSIKI